MTKHGPAAPRTAALDPAVLFLAVFVLVAAAPVPSSAGEEDSGPAGYGQPEGSGGLGIPPEGGGYELQWIESINEVLDKPIFSAEGLPGELPNSTRTAGAVIAREQDWSLAPTVVEPMIGEAGFDFRREGPADLVPVVRGLSGRRVALFLDDFRLDSLADPPGLTAPLSAVDPFHILRAEILRGPSSALYGTGAMGGVVYILGQKRTYLDNAVGANADFTGRFSGADREVSGNAFGEMNVRDMLGAAVSASARNLGDTAVDKKIYRTSFHTDNVFTALDGYVGDRLTVTGWFRSMDQQDVPFEPFTPRAVAFDTQDIAARSRDRHRRWDIAMLTVAARRLSRAMPYFRVNFFYAQKNLERVQPYLGSPDELALQKIRVDRMGVDSIFEFSAAKFLDVVFGAEFAQDRVASNASGLEYGNFVPVAPLIPDGAVCRLYAAHLEPKITVLKRVKLIPSVRVEKAEMRARPEDANLSEPDVRYGKVAYGGGVTSLVRVTPHNSFYGGYLQGYRFPDLQEVAGSGRQPEWYRVPGDDLHPEYARSGEIGFRMHFPFVKGQIAGYSTRLDDRIETACAQFASADSFNCAQPVSSRNAGGAKIRGVEGNVDTYLGVNWNWGFALAWQKGDLDDGSSLGGVPPFLGNTHLRWTSDTGDFAIDVASRFAGRQDELSPEDAALPGVKDGGLPAFMTLDLRLSANYARNAEIKLGALNVTGARVQRVGSSVPETGPNFIAQAVFHIF